MGFLVNKGYIGHIRHIRHILARIEGNSDASGCTFYNYRIDIILGSLYLETLIILQIYHNLQYNF